MRGGPWLFINPLPEVTLQTNADHMSEKQFIRHQRFVVHTFAIAQARARVIALRPRTSQFNFSSFLANVSGTACETRYGCIALGFRSRVQSKWERARAGERGREREREREKERERERARETRHTIHFFLVKVWGQDVAKSTAPWQ